MLIPKKYDTMMVAKSALFDSGYNLVCAGCAVIVIGLISMGAGVGQFVGNNEKSRQTIQMFLNVVNKRCAK